MSSATSRWIAPFLEALGAERAPTTLVEVMAQADTPAGTPVADS